MSTELLVNRLKSNVFVQIEHGEIHEHETGRGRELIYSANG